LELFCSARSQSEQLRSFADIEAGIGKRSRHRWMIVAKTFKWQ